MGLLLFFDSRTRQSINLLYNDCNYEFRVFHTITSKSGATRICEMVGLIGDHISPFPLNSRVRVHEDYGTVRYYGEVGVNIDFALKLT